jgi:hypothetical protein
LRVLIGFSLTLKTETSIQAFIPLKKKTFIYVSQFATSISQNNVNSFTIRYLKKRLDNECKKNNDIIHDYLIDFINHIINIYTYSLYFAIRCQENIKLSSNDLIRILSEILPWLNEKSILKLRKKENFVIMFKNLSCTYRDINQTKLIEGSNDYPKYFYDRKSFKIIDLIIKYNLLEKY